MVSSGTAQARMEMEAWIDDNQYQRGNSNRSSPKSIVCEIKIV